MTSSKRHLDSSVFAIKQNFLDVIMSDVTQIMVTLVKDSFRQIFHVMIVYVTLNYIYNLWPVTAYYGGFNLTYTGVGSNITRLNKYSVVFKMVTRHLRVC